MGSENEAIWRDVRARISNSGRTVATRIYRVVHGKRDGRCAFGKRKKCAYRRLYATDVPDSSWRAKGNACDAKSPHRKTATMCDWKIVVSKNRFGKIEGDISWGACRLAEKNEVRRARGEMRFETIARE